MVTRRGFTLVEVMVAVAVTSLLALLAHRLFEAGVVGARTLAEARAAEDRTANAHRFLTAALLSLDMGAAAGHQFEGYDDRIRFGAWLETADGWFEPRPMEIGLQDTQLTMTMGPAGRIVLADSVTALRIDYRLDPGAAAPWIAEWVSPLEVPLAIRLRIRRMAGAGSGVDTMVYLLGRRE